MRKIILFILVLAGLAGMLGYYYYQKNIYSKGNLRLEILGPQDPQTFEEVEYLVKYKNNGNIVLEEPKLTFQYPENSLPSAGDSLRTEKNLEDIYPGEEKTFSFKTRLFGKEGETRKAEASLRYRPRNLKAFYESKTTFSSKIRFAPLTFELDLPSKIEADREATFYLNYFSNADLPLSNLRVKVEYPAGFEFLESKPKALGKSEWDLPLLNKAEGGRIEIKGKLSGDQKQQKIFRATLGIWQEGEFTLLKEAVKGTEITQSSLSVFQLINGASEYTASAGDILHYEIFFRNTSPEPYQDLFLVLKFAGQLFNFDSVKTDSGQFQRGDNSLVWDWREIPKLKFLDQGEEGKVEFWIDLKKDWQPLSSQDRNSVLKNTVILSQTRRDFETKVNSKLTIEQQGFFRDTEVFENLGPLPPRVGETTTYTINWRVRNYYNNVNNVKVKAILPQEVKLTGRISSQDSRLTFDSESREIVWEVGNLEAGAGLFNSPSFVAFQIAFTPQESQRGKVVQLVSEAAIFGEDDFTRQNLSARAPAITTSSLADQAAAEEMSRVQ